VGSRRLQDRPRQIWGRPHQALQNTNGPLQRGFAAIDGDACESMLYL